MESAALLGFVDQLDGNLGQLEEALGPILEESLNATSKKLPLLDRAKLNITVVYAIESLLFCEHGLLNGEVVRTLISTAYLKVNGVDPKSHAIFKEIERVKQYFNKIKEAEEKSVITKPSTTLNKQAAARIIQHSLVREEVGPRIVSDKKQAGNGASDLSQREREARERLMLKLKQRSQSSTSTPTPQQPTVETSTSDARIPSPSSAQHEDVEMQHDDSSAEEGEIDEEDVSIQAPEPSQSSIALKQPHLRKRKQKQNSDSHSKLSADRKAEKRARKKAKKEAKASANGVGNSG